MPPERYEEFRRELLDEVRSVPGVLNAATTTNAPLLGGSWTHNIHVGSAEGPSKFTWVSPSYLETMGVPLQAGRGFNAGDTAASPRVAIVNQAFIRKFTGGINPIGQTLRTSPEPQYPSTVYEIVGVIPDTKYNDIRGETPPMAFAPASQFPAQKNWTLMMIYSNASPEAAVARKIAEAHPEIVMQFSDFEQDIRDGLLRERLLAMLSGFFGLLAAMLAMVGLYGLISYVAARRRNEIGVRMALGADRGQIVGMVMREAGYLLLMGIVTGSVLSLIAGRGVSSLLFGLKPYDPLTLLVSIALLSLIAALASLLPARRAAKARSHGRAALRVRRTMQTLMQDVRYGLRMLRKSPGLTAIILIMLTMGIGATTAVFTVFDAILLRPLAYEKPEQLVQIWEKRTEGSFQQSQFSYPDYLDVKRENKVFSQIGGYSKNSVTLSGKEGAEQLQVAVATTGFFETLGVQPILGRTFAAGEDDLQKNFPVMLSYGAWQRRFGGNPGVVGTALVLDGELATVVGVLPKNFVFAPTQSAELWMSPRIAGFSCVETLIGCIPWPVSSRASVCSRRKLRYRPFRGGWPCSIRTRMPA